MKKKMKMLGIFLVSTMIMFILSGCMGLIAEVKINEDGSGTMVAKVGFAKEFFESTSSDTDIEDMKEFEWNGITYYGEVDTQPFNNIDELKEAIEETSDTENNGLKIIKYDNGTYRIRINTDEINNEIQKSQENATENVMNDPETTVDVDSKLLEDMIKNSMCVVYSFEFPGEVVIEEGIDKYGVVLNGNKITLDIMKLTPGGYLVFSSKNKNGESAPDYIPEIIIDKPITAISFSDIKDDDWYEPAVNAMAFSGIINGTGNGKFEPNKELTYAELYQIISKAMNMETGEKNGYWAFKAIENMYNTGIIEYKGAITPENFNKLVDRQHAIRDIYMAGFIQGKFFPDKSIEIEIPDIDKIDENLKEEIINAYRVKITTGIDEEHTFNPTEIITRAEICQLFYNINWVTPDN